ncbi:NTP transferase domain-containing protein [Candidatus Roizmanbacteria bacterium]|nr:NTP transferase domain-containing protein [Candidatus Roizmanbacteria bacterium]
MRKIKNALLLAGGDSTRFWPLENKNLYSFLGKPLILHQIEKISLFVENIFIVVHKENAVAVKRLVDNANLLVKIEIVIQKDDFSGQAGAVFSVKNLVRGETIILNANDLVDYSAIEKITQTPAHKNKVILFGKKVNEYFPGGYFKFDSNENVEKIVEKPGKDKMPSNITKLVVDYYSDIDNLVKAIEKVKTNEDNHYEIALNHLLDSGVEKTYFIYEGFWVSLKYPWHILSMLKLFLGMIKTSDISSTAEISKKAIISGPVVIGDNVKIGDFAKISGPVFIGDNSTIGDYSLIRESQIGEDCLIGSYNEVARSYIGNKVFLHRNYVGDSVLADEVIMGAQAVTANLRFDGETINSYVDDDKVDTYLSKMGAVVGRQAKIGVNATITPGVKIGKKTWVGPGEIVRYDLEDKTYLSDGEEKENLYE